MSVISLQKIAKFALLIHDEIMFSFLWSMLQVLLSSVSDLASSFIDPSSVNISWSPPFTLPGTTITGYNISVTSNGTTTINTLHQTVIMCYS